MKTAQLIIAFCLMSILSFAQKVENVDLHVSDNKVIVTYDLTNCPDNYTYDLKVKIKKETGDYIYPKNISGDLKGVLPGHNRTISWDVLADGIELQGNILPIVEIENSTYGSSNISAENHLKLKGGPANAFLSLLIPGLGDHFVNVNPKMKRKNWYFVPFSYALCAGTAIVTYSAYHSNYSNYHSATTQDNMDKYYNAANTNYKIFQVSAGIAASIMIFDVIHVAVKGSKNKHNQLKGSYVSDLKTNFYFVSTNPGLKLGLIYKF